MARSSTNNYPMLQKLFQWRSLKSRVLVLTLGIFLVSIWSLSFYVVRILKDDLQIMLSEQQFANVSQMAALIDGALEDRLQSLEIIAASLNPAVLRNPARLQTALNEQVLALRLFNGGIFVADARGTAIADAPQVAGRLGTNYMDRSSVALPLKDGRSMIGKPALGKKLLAPIFSISTPIRDREGTVIGVLVGTVNLGLPNFLTPILDQPYGKTGGYFLVAPQHQLIVSATDESLTMQPTPAIGLNSMQDQYMQGFEGYGVSRDSAGVPGLNAAKGIPASDWFLAVNLPLTEAFSPIHDMQKRMLLATLLLTFLTGVLTWWTLKRQLAPMQQAAKTIALQSHTNLSLQPLPVQHHDEIGDLIRGFNRLLAVVSLREAALHESEQRFRNLIDHNNAVILQIDPASGRILDANASASVFYGWTRAQLCGMNIQDINTLSPQEVDGELVEAAHRKRNYVESLHSLANGESRSVEVHVTSIASGPNTVLVAIIHDITARKLIEEEKEKLDHRLRDQQFYTRSLIESNMDALVTTDAAGTITDVNKQMELLTDCTREELIGAQFKNYFTDPGRAETAINRALSEKMITNYELTARNREGLETVVSLNASIFFDHNLNLQGVFAAARDVTERKRLDRALLEKNGELESARRVADKANLAKSDFLSSMSHELRSPLNAILGFAQLMESETPPPPKLQQERIAHILRGGWHLLNLINEILDLTKIEARQISLSIEPVALAATLSDCHSMFEQQAHKRGITLVFPPADLPYVVMADQTRLKQVLINLLTNAIKYNAFQGTIEVSCTPCAGSRIRVSIRDTGLGLSAEQLPQLFQAFNRLGQEGSAIEGTGIGLVVAKQLVELMDGTIGAESEVGRGSVFWFELPAGAAPALAIESDVARPALPVARGPTPARTVLYVEDNPANVALVEQIMGRHPDRRFLTAADGHSGIALARKELPDVILLDINLPGLNGFEMLRLLRADPVTSHIPVLAISASASPSDIKKGSEAGFLRYVTKPIRVDELMQALSVALQLSERREL